jgi:hypothetical protein
VCYPGKVKPTLPDAIIIDLEASEKNTGYPKYGDIKNAQVRFVCLAHDGEHMGWAPKDLEPKDEDHVPKARSLVEERLKELRIEPPEDEAKAVKMMMEVAGPTAKQEAPKKALLDKVG